MNTKEKRWVLCKVLNSSRDCCALIWRGRLYHSFGATTGKALSPSVLRSHLSTARSSWLEDLSVLEAVSGCISSDIWDVSKSFKPLKTMNKTLKCIQKLTGRQCKEERTWVRCSRHYFPVNRWTTAFWINWRWPNGDWLRPANKKWYLKPEILMSGINFLSLYIKYNTCWLTLPIRASPSS